VSGGLCVKFVRLWLEEGRVWGGGGVDFMLLLLVDLAYLIVGRVVATTEDAFDVLGALLGQR
jgi:hypothetical protein